MPISRQASSPALRHSSSTSAPAPLVDLLDPGRVDPAVDDQRLHRDPGDLAADRVEAAQHHGLGGVVDDDVDAGDLLEGPDVAALAADDPALHVVAGQVHHRDRRLGGLLGREPLHDGAQHAAGLGLRLRRGPSARCRGRATAAWIRASCSTAGEQLLHAPPRRSGGRSARGRRGARPRRRPARARPRGASTRPAAASDSSSSRGLAFGEPVLAPLDVEPLLLQVAVQVRLAAGGDAGATAGRPRRQSARTRTATPTRTTTRSRPSRTS